jgi:hypothetical protein
MRWPYAQNVQSFSMPFYTLIRNFTPYNIVYLLGNLANCMNYIILNKYKEHPDARIDPSLFWEYDLAKFDYQQMKNVVVQRVIERGWPEDWWAILNLYGEDNLRNIIKDMPYLGDDDMKFVSEAFKIPLTEMKCYERKQSRPQHWSS